MNYQRKFEIENAIEYFNKALNLLNSITQFDVSSHPALWNNISMVYTIKGNHKKAIDLLYEAEKNRLSWLRGIWVI